VGNFTATIEGARAEALAGDYKGAGRAALEAVSLARSADECDAVITFCDQAYGEAGRLSRGRFKSARDLASDRKSRLVTAH
jgi:hypothetical protein